MAGAADLEALVALEHLVFTGDRMSRRGMRHLLRSATASILVAEDRGAVVGCAVVLFRRASTVARLYSLAVAPGYGGRGIGAALLDAAEARARTRRCGVMRLEVHAANRRAIRRYRSAGYMRFGLYPGYYADGGDALRFEKPLRRPVRQGCAW